MPKHTPGPWKHNTLTEIGGRRMDCIYAESPFPGGKTIIIRTGRIRGGETEAANIKLATAAPELLEALDDCITNENATCIVQNDVAYMIRRLKAINQICRAAIAKATAE